MRQPDRRTFERIVKLFHKDPDVCDYLNEVLSTELNALIYAKNEDDYRVAQGRVQIFKELVSMLEQARNSI